MMERFLFPTQLQGQPIGKLSGGGAAAAVPPLPADGGPPTSCRWTSPPTTWTSPPLAILEEYLETFPGAVLAVSHDRYFLDKMAHQIFEVGGGRPGHPVQRQLLRLPGQAPGHIRPRPGGEGGEEACRQARPAKKLKFTFKEQREYDTIEADIAALEARIAQREGRCWPAAATTASSRT